MPPLAMVAGYALLSLAFTWPLVLHLNTHLTGDVGGDTGVYVWNQWVFRHEALVERGNPLTTEKVLSLMQRTNLAQHNYTAFLNLLAVPLQPLLGVVATFNVVFLVMTTLNGVFTYALARGITPASRPQAFLAGVAFAWSPVLVARGTSHYSLAAAACLPAFILCLVRAGRSLRARDGALAGLCMAWAGFCDAYYAVYCLLIATGYLLHQFVFVSRDAAEPRSSWLAALDILMLCVAGLIAGLLLGRGGQLDVWGVGLSVRGLYTPVLVLTLLAVTRLVLSSKRRLVPVWRWSPRAAVAIAAGVVACGVPMAPVAAALVEDVQAGGSLSPVTLWRSSPRGLDLISFFTPNPNHPLIRELWFDRQLFAPVTFVEYTGAFSLVALAIVVIAVWRARHRLHGGWLLLTVGCSLLALGPFVYVMGVNTHVPGPWALLRYVPLLGAARMPTRFSVLAALGLAMLMAAALAALEARYPAARRRIVVIAAAALLFELLPAPRLLYSAEVPSLYRIVAADSRPVKLLELPFGVRDGVSSAGNFSARYQYFQTTHGKSLLGGYLSRVPRRKLERMRHEYPVVDALITLSEGKTLSRDQIDRFHDRQPGFVERVRLGWVVIDHALVSPELTRFALHAFRLEEVAREGTRTLYRPAAPADAARH